MKILAERKILRVDNQYDGHWGYEEKLFKSKEHLRKWLSSFHSVDWTGEENINELTLEDLCDYGDWDFREIEEQE